MTPEHLLPSNATPLEQGLSKVTDPLARLALPSDAIRTFKRKPNDPLLPWLIWEYGLGELLPYLKEPRQAIAEGLLWQRLRGTPAALSTALAWVGMRAFVEQEPPGVHFAQFQLDPGGVIESDTDIANLVAIARLSAPARARLSRVYHGYDLRRMVLDDSRLGEALLSDHSGVFWQDGNTKLSFGRHHQWPVAPHDVALVTRSESVRVAVARLIDRYQLDYSSLGDLGHTPNEAILHSHLFTLANAQGVADQKSLLPERRFAKAQVVLSDSTPLGDINAHLPGFIWQETGQAIRLGTGDLLSATPHQLIRVAVLERFIGQQSKALAVPGLVAKAHLNRIITQRVHARADQALGVWRLGESVPSLDRGFVRREHSRTNPALPDAAGWRAKLYQKAQVVLSEVALGDINTRTPRCALRRTRPLSILGDLILGEVAEVEWQALTQMQIGIVGLSAIERIDFAESAVSVQRLLTLFTDASTDMAAHPSRDSETSTRAAWTGQTWTGVRWPASTWRDTREVIGVSHLTLS